MRLDLGMFLGAQKRPLASGPPELQKIWITFGIGNDEVWSFDPDGTGGVKKFDLITPGSSWISEGSFDFDERKFWYHKNNDNKLYWADIDTGANTLVGTTTPVSGIIVDRTFKKPGQNQVFLTKNSGTARGAYSMSLADLTAWTLRTRAGNDTQTVYIGWDPNGDGLIHEIFVNAGINEYGRCNMTDYTLETNIINSASLANHFTLRGFYRGDTFTTLPPNHFVGATNSAVPASRISPVSIGNGVTGLTNAQRVAINPWPYLNSATPNDADVYFTRQTNSALGGFWVARYRFNAAGAGATVVSGPTQLASIANTTIVGIDLEFSPIPTYA